MAATPRSIERLALRMLTPADAAANRLYGWKYNPLYQSGTIVTALLLVLLVTGLWLIFFYRVGSRMGMNALPETLAAWEKMRQEHLYQNLKYSDYTRDLFLQYRKHLGPVRYKILLEAQTLVAPQHVRKLLGMQKLSVLKPLLLLYKLTRKLQMDWMLKKLILPSKYMKEIRALDA